MAEHVYLSDKKYDLHFVFNARLIYYHAINLMQFSQDKTVQYIEDIIALKCHTFIVLTEMSKTVLQQVCVMFTFLTGSV